MKRRLCAAFTALSLLACLIPAAFADGPEDICWLLPADVPIEAFSDDELADGGLAPPEGMYDTPRNPDGITGVRNVLVAPIRFAGEAEFLDDRPEGYGGRTLRELIDLSYSGSDVSVRSYYSAVSFGAVDIVPAWLLEEEGSIQLIHPRSYYMPWSLDNPDGYLQHDRIVRIFTAEGQPTGEAACIPELECSRNSSDGADHVLLSEDTGELLAICTHMDVRARQRADGRLELVWNGGLSDDHLWADSACFYDSDYADRLEAFQSEVYTTVNALAHRQGIGELDCVTLWFSGDTDGWNSILWPHQGQFSAWGPTCYRSGADKLYIALFANDALSCSVTGRAPDGASVTLPQTGTLSHELGHMLGFPDYYSYIDQTDLNLGYWSLMEYTNDTPQSIHGWAAYLYGGWLKEANVRQISAEGTYTVTTLSGAGPAERDSGAVYLYYIDNPAADPAFPEQIVLEYRSPRGVFEQALSRDGLMPVPGLILYSVDDNAERILGGNMGANGRDGRYGARLYRVSGLGGSIIPGYQERSRQIQQLYDTLLSPLSSVPARLAAGTFSPLRSYGSPDPEETENALVSRRTGQNSGIVICNAAIDPDDETKLTFWVDLDAPAVTGVEDDRRLGVRTVTLTFDEPVAPGPGLADPSAVPGLLSAAAEGPALTLTLTGANAGGTLSLPADGVADQAGRAMESPWQLTLPPADRHASFADVPQDHPAFAAVTAMADAAILRGVDADHFAPDAPLTRAAFLTALSRLAGGETAPGGTGFSDVLFDAWYAPAVKWAGEAGILTGTEDGVFAPDSVITREQMALLLFRCLQWAGCELPRADGADIPDDDAVSSWARPAVRAVWAAGLMSCGEDGTFRPAQEVTRAQAAQALQACMERMEARQP